ncbi:hypothetical protein [Bosea thiooxidans]
MVGALNELGEFVADRGMIVRRDAAVLDCLTYTGGDIREFIAELAERAMHFGGVEPSERTRWFPHCAAMTSVMQGSPHSASSFIAAESVIRSACEGSAQRCICDLADAAIRPAASCVPIIFTSALVAVLIRKNHSSFAIGASKSGIWA